MNINGDIFWDDCSENLENLCSGIKNLKNLRHLILRLTCPDNVIEDESRVYKLRDILKSLPYMNNLNIHFDNCSQNNPFSTVNNFEIISGVFKDLTQLEYLNLKFFENFIGDNKEDIKIIANSLINLKNLKSLSINFGLFNAFMSKLGEDTEGIRIFTESIGNNLT